MAISYAQAQTTHPDSSLLTAYESGRVRAFRRLPEPAGATRELRRGYADAIDEMADAGLFDRPTGGTEE